MESIISYHPNGKILLNQINLKMENSTGFGQNIMKDGSIIGT